MEGGIMYGREVSLAVGGWVRRVDLGVARSGRTIEKGQIRHLATKPEDLVAQKLYIREGADGRDNHSAEQSEQQEKEERESQVVRPLEGGRDGGPGNNRDKNMKREQWSLQSLRRWLSATSNVTLMTQTKCHRVTLDNIDLAGEAGPQV
jgi:hypothetical protein